MHLNIHNLLIFLMFPVVLVFNFTSCHGEDGIYTIHSPDRTITVHFQLDGEDQKAGYKILRSGSVVLEESELGFTGDSGDFSSGLTLVSAGSLQRIEESYEMLQGKKRNVTYTANERTFRLENHDGEAMEIVFRVSDDGVGFRYRLPEENGEMRRINEENTSFVFPAGSKSWLTPMAEVNTGWSETNPSYEEHYLKSIDAGTPSPTGAGWSYPALFETEAAWVLITEAGLDGSYPGTRLRTASPEGAYQIGFPMDEEVTTGGILGPEFEVTWSSPWRILAIGDLATIVESTLGTDLADPPADEYTGASYIQPGRASWSWAKLKDESVNFNTQVEFIDYAAEMGWEYTLVDVNWYRTIGFEGIAELAEYAGSKGVGLWLWYNSSGDWNSTEYSPKSRLLTHEDRVEQFSRIREMGIRGIKVDFFPGDGQSAMQYYIDIFEDAHKYELMVNTHGSTIPRGWHRTWPNLMTMESVKGFEFITFEQVNAHEAASHSTILPFTRNAFDTMDFTPMSLDRIPGIERRTTGAHELALPVLFLSGVQHYAETPAGMETVPEYVKEFVRKIPAVWDESRFIDGYPGEFVIIARRHGNRWFVGGINGREEPKSVAILLPFLTGQTEGTLIGDGEDLFSFRQEEITLSSDDEILVEMGGNGGFVLFLEHVPF